MFRCWADIEDIVQTSETTNEALDHLKNSTQKAFKDSIELMKKIKSECLQEIREGLKAHETVISKNEAEIR